MKPDWDTLMEEYADSPKVLVTDVDCTTGGKDLCSQVGVSGYPTIKWGDPSDLQEYEGGRELDALKEFAQGLGPSCGPDNMDLCSDEKKKQIEEVQAMGADAREKRIEEDEAKIKGLEEGLQKLLESLQKQYGDGKKKKDEDIAGVKAAGLGLLKSVHAHAKKTAGSE